MRSKCKEDMGWGEFLRILWGDLLFQRQFPWQPDSQMHLKQNSSEAVLPDASIQPESKIRKKKEKAILLFYLYSTVTCPKPESLKNDFLLLFISNLNKLYIIHEISQGRWRFTHDKMSANMSHLFTLALRLPVVHRSCTSNGPSQSLPVIE